MRITRRLLCSCATALLFAMAVIGPMRADDPLPDADADGMPDAYEMLFDLDPSDGTDAESDYDRDWLSNVEEARLGTDPWQVDTDRDGWPDVLDQNPRSRAYVLWGDPDFTDGETYFYPGPSWWLGAFKQGGTWNTNPPCWIAECTSGDDGLFLLLDPTQLKTDIAVDLDFLAPPGATVRWDLLTSDFKPLSGAGSNLVCGGEERGISRLDLPTGQFTNAAAIRLTTTGPVAVYQALLYIDRNHDGLDAEQNRQLGPPESSPEEDAGGGTGWGGGRRGEEGDGAGAGGGDDGSRCGATGSGTDGRPDGPCRFYVDAGQGNDGRDGMARHLQDAQRGPKRTIRAALAAARDGDTIVICEGVYREDVDVFGRALTVVLDGDVVLN